MGSKSPNRSEELDGNIATLTQQLAERGFYILGVRPPARTPDAARQPWTALAADLPPTR